MNLFARSAGMALSVAAAGLALALSGGTAHASEQQPPQQPEPAPQQTQTSWGLININGPLIYNTGDIDLIEDVFEHISIPILGQAVHQMYDWAKFDGVLNPFKR